MDEELEELTLPDNLDQLSETQLRELHTDYVSRITELRDEEVLTVAQARELRRLVEEANTVGAVINEVAAPMPAVDDTNPARPEVPTVTAEAPVSAEAVEAPAEISDEVVPDELPQPVAASIRVNELDTPDGGPGSETPNIPGAVFTASASQADYTAGAELTIEDLGHLFESAGREQISGGNYQGKARLASIDRYVDGAPRLGSDKYFNTQLINSLPQHDPKTAAICGPIDIVRPIPDCVDTGRYIRNMFRQVPAPRGAFQFMKSIGLADVSDAVTIWTDADQAAIDPNDQSTWKQCHALVCEPTITTQVEAIVACLTVETKQEFSAPEQVQNNINTIAALTDRVAEGELLRRIDALSSAYTFTGDYGSLPRIVQLIETLIGRSMSVSRSVTPDNYRVILPAGLLQQLTIDSMNRGFRDACCPDEVMKMFMEMGIGSPVVTPDFATGDLDPWAAFALNPPGAAAVVLPDAPTVWKIRVIDASQGFYYDTGGRAFGVERSPELSRQNKVQWFGEQFEGLDKQGCVPWFTINATLCPNGDRAGFSAPVVCP